jgi:hypothetical protein
MFLFALQVLFESEHPAGRIHDTSRATSKNGVARKLHCPPGGCTRLST